MNSSAIYQPHLFPATTLTSPTWEIAVSHPGSSGGALVRVNVASTLLRAWLDRGSWSDVVKKYGRLNITSPGFPGLGSCIYVDAFLSQAEVRGRKRSQQSFCQDAEVHCLNVPVPPGHSREWLDHARATGPRVPVLAELHPRRAVQHGSRSIRRRSRDPHHRRNLRGAQDQGCV